MDLTRYEGDGRIKAEKLCETLTNKGIKVTLLDRLGPINESNYVSICILYRGNRGGYDGEYRSVEEHLKNNRKPALLVINQELNNHHFMQREENPLNHFTDLHQRAKVAKDFGSHIFNYESLLENEEIRNKFINLFISMM